MSSMLLAEMILILSLLSLDAVSGFLPPQTGSGAERALFLSAEFEAGWGRNKRYDLSDLTDESSGNNLCEVTDVEAEMTDFFLTNYDWQPLFRSLSADTSVPAMCFLGGDCRSDAIDFSAGSFPWKQLEAIPSDERDKNEISKFLDSMQKALIDIPVSDTEEDDEFDKQFIQEGRRMLAVSRFQVVRGTNNDCINLESTIDDLLFSTCWNEVAELARADEPDTGSLIVLPNYSFDQVDHFSVESLRKPLEWMGVAQDFEVASIQRSSPALRLLHKLSDIPTDV